MSAKRGNGGKKPRRKATHFEKQLLALQDRYAKETSETEVRPIDVAVWAIRNELIEIPEIDIAQQLARLISRANQHDMIEDENGEPVRNRHPYRIKEGDQYRYLWMAMKDMSPGKYRLSAQLRLLGIGADCAQHQRDTNYYNKNHNPGEPFFFSYDFDKTLKEKKQPTEFIDAPPEEDDLTD